jgi:sporulation protein YhbH
MTMKIEHDVSRFREIVKGKIRENLRKYVTHGEMIGRKGRDLVSIPIPQLDVPHFRYGKNGSGGVGQGEGEEGQPIGKGEDEASGKGQAGGDPAGHVIEVEVSLEELAAILGNELQLPRIEPKGKANITEEKVKYSSIRSTGPESLRHFRRTYMQALKRQISSNTYNVAQPEIVPYREDKRYRSWTTHPMPDSNAVAIYLMDVSGSMTDDQKEIVRTEAFWIDTWLKSHYQGLERRFIIHDAAAKIVDEETFYHTRESGGTRISSAYKACLEILQTQFPPAEWNVYCFQFSDGDNWGEDNQQSLAMLKDQILPHVNLFCYGQVESPYGSGEYLRTVKATLGDTFDNLVLSEIKNKEAIYDSIRQFLGKGK